MSSLNSQRNNAKISITCYAVALVFFLILGILPRLNSTVTLFLRPLILLFCIINPTQYANRLSRSTIILLILQFYMVFVFVIHEPSLTNLKSWISVLLFALFYVFLIYRTWNRQEIIFLLHVVVFATFVYSLVVLTQNTHLFHENASEDITFFGVHVNANTAAFATVPGLLSSLYLLLFSSASNLKLRLSYYLILALGVIGFFVVLIGLGGRSAFFSAALGATLIVWEWSAESHTIGKRNSIRALLILLLVLLYYYGPIITEGTHAYRLFDYDNITDLNGRDDLAEIAWRLIHEHPIFGGGYDYWDLHSDSSVALHNTFLLFGVWGGYTAMVLLILFYVVAAVELLTAKNYISLAFYLEALFHSLTEPGMDYYAYIPLTIAFILHLYSKGHRCLTSQIVKR